MMLPLIKNFLLFQPPNPFRTMSHDATVQLMQDLRRIMRLPTLVAARLTGF